MLGLRSQRGDTIVEVLVVLTILSSAFALAYATANRSLVTTRASQEHSEALQFIASQVELLRVAAQASINIYTSPGSYCMATGPLRVVPFSASYDASTATAASDDFTKYPAECQQGDQNRYFMSISYSARPAGNPNTYDIFTLFVRWDGPGTTGRQQETITYKLHP